MFYSIHTTHCHISYTLLLLLLYTVVQLEPLKLHIHLFPHFWYLYSSVLFCIGDNKKTRCSFNSVELNRTTGPVAISWGLWNAGLQFQLVRLLQQTTFCNWTRCAMFDVLNSISLCVHHSRTKLWQSHHEPRKFQNGACTLVCICSIYKKWDWILCVHSGFGVDSFNHACVHLMHLHYVHHFETTVNK